MMPRRANGAKSVRELTLRHAIDGRDHRARRPKGCLSRTGGHGGIGVDSDQAFLSRHRRDLVQNQLNHIGVVSALQHFPSGSRRLIFLYPIEFI
jgi:hypothetical protein